MGKANRIKSGKGFDYSAKNKKNEKKKSFLYTMILVGIAVLVAAVIIVSTVLSNRTIKAVHTESYALTDGMLQYLYATEYQNFINTYAAYIQQNEDFGPDTEKSLSEQTINKTTAGFIGNEGVTWRDYFLNSVMDRFEQILVYCEIADEKGVSLDEDDMTAIDESIHSIEHSAEDLGYNMTQFLYVNYGDNVDVEDIRDVFELETLATKVAEVIDADLMDGITADEVNAKYNENVKTYQVKDYIYYSLSVSYDSVVYEVFPEYDGEADLTDEQEAKVLEAYKNKIEEAKAKAEAFENYTNAEDFKNAAREDLADISFDSYYETEALEEPDKLSDTDLDTIKAALIEEVIGEIKNNAEMADATKETDGTFTAYGVTLAGENTAKAIDSVKEALYSDLKYVEDYYFSQKMKYDTEDAVSKWVFDEAEGIGDTKKVLTGDGSKEGEIKNDTGRFQVQLYMVTSDEYRDNTVSKNIGYMTFADEASAKKAIESFKAGANKDYAAFEAVAKSCNAVSNGKFENYLKGQLSYGTFETWLYDEETVIGSITETPVTNTTVSGKEYAVFLYYGDGDEAWYIDVKNVIFVDDYQDYYKAMTEKYPLTVDDEVVAKIGN